jgi:hypothetical protein
MIEPNWDSSQHRALAREGVGPQLVRGRAGSGRTALGVAYALGVARQRTLTERRILFATPFAEAARAVAALVAKSGRAASHEFVVTSIADLCHDLVARSGRQFELAPDDVRGAFLGDAIASLKRKRPRGVLDRSPTFFVEEISELIKGRALGRRDEYLALEREGRWRGLEQPVRQVVWEVFEEYQMRLEAAGLNDADDLPLLALEALTTEARFDEVVVDDVHGASRPALLLLARLAAPADRLFLLLDEEQAYHRQGFSLKDAGIDVRRSVELTGAYRPRGGVRAFADLVLHGDGPNAAGPVALDGDAVALLEAPSYRTQFIVAVDRVRAELKCGVDPASIGMLLPAFRDVLVARRALAAADLGEAAAAIRILTIDAARGLEFTSAVIVGVNEGVLPLDEAGHELTGRFRDRRRLYVAATRARDRLALVYQAGLRSSFLSSMV